MAQNAPEPAPLARDEGLVTPDPSPTPQDSTEVGELGEDTEMLEPVEGVHPDDVEPMLLPAPEADTSGDAEGDGEVELPPIPQDED